MDYALTQCMAQKINGVSPIYYSPKGKAYILDYSFLIKLILEWMVNELEADRASAENFLSVFVPSVDEKNDANAFLIQVVFDYNLGITATPFMQNSMRFHGENRRKIYYNPVDGDDNEYFFKGIPFSSQKILSICRRDVMEVLIHRRDMFELKQHLFGKNAVSQSVRIPHFYMINLHRN